MLKPHRVLLDRVSGYADEAVAFVRRRRHTRRPFARLYYPDGRSRDCYGEPEAGERLLDSATRLIDLAADHRSEAA